MKKKRSFLYWICTTVFIALTAGPFIWAFIISVTPEFEMFQNTKHFLPSQITWSNYEALFTAGTREQKLLTGGLYNSISTVIITLLIGLPIIIVTAYVLARIDFYGKKLVRGLLLITMVIPVFTTIIPLYRLFVSFQLLDNRFWLSMVYVSSFLPMAVWLVSNYFDTIPKEVEEAALVDGCGRVQSMLRIILPPSYPIIFSAALIVFLNTWSQFQIPLILASSTATKPVTIIASEFMTKDSIQYGVTAAAGLIAIIPPAIAAIIFRKFLVRGMTRGTSK